ncbi:unnamed protein product [Darwinula stevensoni]|uniref:ADP-ribosylhydrolase ARH3 n=1 Tax=Darwinula stevensoni TaxID=69355 RepID=A0A7R8WY34_9CRUS|nr:unnamed protein product [Darwinula stevensoni]CAG0878888.1 unnamed protein product [Darwinula stevensoni]
MLNSEADVNGWFVECYEDEPDRGYGANVGKVFKVLRATSFQNPFLPAREQFAGGGSYGNGAAMRVSPVGLFYSRDSEESEAIKVAKMQSLVTHAHPLGYFGAILMCLAIREALKVPSDTPVNPDEFLDALQLKLNALPFVSENDGDVVEVEAELKKMKITMMGVKMQAGIEVDQGGKKLLIPGESREEGAAAEYREKLLACRKLLKKDFDKDEIVNQLGNSVSAVDSVITAFYCFLACYNYNQAHEFMVEASGNEEGMEKSLRLACMLGGDTDTIANMACALVGAHVGLNSRICFLLDSCEEGNEPLDLGRHIYDLVYPSAS